MDNKLSVIVPVYNVKEYLEQCIESILKQKYPAMELILVDDGSSDGSGEICEKYALLDNRVQVIHQSNQGHTAARQNGFLASDGEYIIFIDSDDWIADNMFQLMMERIIGESADIVQCSYKAVINQKHMESVSPYDEGFYDKKMLRELIYPTMIYHPSAGGFGIAPNMWNKIFRRSLVEKYLFQIDKRIRSGEDGLLTFRCFMEAERVYNFKECFYYYRSREVSMCRITDDKRLDENHILFQYYQKWLMPYDFLQDAIKHYVVIQTLQAVEQLLKKQHLFKIKKAHPYLRKESLERVSIHDVKLSEINGKKNKLILIGLKL